MTHIDHQINRFLETLAEHGLREKTIICFVSDHGELMGDHNLFRKALPYEGAARIPFILHGPPETGFRQGHVIDAVAELRDVMPTLLDGAGLPIPDSVEGQSVIPLAQGRRVPWRDYIHGEHPALGQAIHWITDGREKYIWFSDSGREQLFDLVEDPTECRDLGRQPGSEPRLAHWRRILIGELQGREEGYSDGERLITKRPVQSVLSHISAPT
jgi:arylsulfatase A-like enzyme